MATFNNLINTETNEHHKRVFEILASHESQTEETQDGYKEIVLDSSELTMIRDELYGVVQDARAGESITLTEMKEKLHTSAAQRLQDKASEVMAEARGRQELQQNKGIVQDGYMNTTSGIGTLIDPGMDTEVFNPVSITPTEASAYYANGGIPARIINKKAGCLALDGVHFECDAFNPDDLIKLEAHAQKTGFDTAYLDGLTQGLTFGGAVVYPVLAGDTPVQTQLGMEELKKKLAHAKGNLIKYWVVADRWNCVFTPQYNITAQDYLYAKSLFIPLGGVRVNTERMAMIRPTRLPFWSAIQQMGWSTSEFEGWIKDFESYQIMKMSLPIMAQQCSLMYHAMPADGLIIENGPDYARRFFAENERELREWSMLHPKAINSIGEIKILERSYSGYRDLVNESKIALCAASGMQESVIFAEQPHGLASDNKDDVELKQSETIRLLFNNVAPAFKNCIELLVYDCFGIDSEQAKHAKEVRIKADDGVILSDQDKAQLGQAFIQIAGGAAQQLGMPITSAIKLGQKFVPSAEIDQETMDKLEQGESEGMDSEMWDQLNGGRAMTQPGGEFEQNPEIQETEGNDTNL